MPLNDRIPLMVQAPDIKPMSEILKDRQNLQLGEQRLASGAQDLQLGQQNIQKGENNLEAQNLEGVLQKQNAVVNLLSGAIDQQSWSNGLQRAASMGLPVDQVPQQFDAQWRDQALNQALSVKQKLQLKLQEMKSGLVPKPIQTPTAGVAAAPGGVTAAPAIVAPTRTIKASKTTRGGKGSSVFERLSDKVMTYEQRLQDGEELSSAEKQDYNFTKQKLSGSNEFRNENTLRDEFNTLTKDFRTVQDAYSKIKATSTTGPGDMSMLYQYVRLLDPGSVVRESEFEAAAKSGSFGDRIANAAKSITVGGRLDASLRKQFMDEAKRIFDGQKLGYDRTKKNYGETAKRYKLAPENVIQDYAAENDVVPAPAPTSPAVTSPDGWQSTTSGVKYKVIP